MKLHIDIETYSSENLKTSGVYRYCESVDFEILMVAFAYEDNPVQIIDLARGEELPQHFLNAVVDEKTTLCAHNATFERLAFEAFGISTKISKWECTLIKAAYCGFPLSLDTASEAMGLAEKKDSEGKRLISYFCGLIKPTKINGQRTRNFPDHDLEKWQKFKEYCVQDVEVERAIDEHLTDYEITKFEKDMYVLDQEINDRGIKIDTDFAKTVIRMNDVNSNNIKDRMRGLTELENPNSPVQLTRWLSEAIGIEVKSLAKAEIPKLIEEAEQSIGENPEIVKEVLRLRQRASKTSIKKYVAMLNCVGADGRGRGFFQFYGANRTGRWAGRLVQMQNLPGIKMTGEDLDEARYLVSCGDFNEISKKYDRVSDTLSQLIRPTFVAKEDHTFAVADFSAIEARVIAWLASEEWRLEVFRTHGKIYEASAAMMFGVPIEEVTKGSDYRAKGKVAELALGYQGSIGALKKMGAEKMGLTETEMQAIVNKWRAKSPRIKKLWDTVNKAAIEAIRSKRGIVLKQFRGLRFLHDGRCLRITLPSGRELFYQEATLDKNRFDQTSVKYKGIVQETRKWGWIDSYGGKFVENIVQAIARDILAVSMMRLKEEGYAPVLHVHDEAAMEIPAGGVYGEELEELEEIEHIMGRPIEWANGLPLDAEGYLSDYYKKD